MSKQFYAVEITTASGPEISRTFQTLRAARKWASWCCAKWAPVRILRGGQGGDEVK